MPIEPGATYVFDLAYYSYEWWAQLHAQGCRFVTRLKKNSPVSLIETRATDPDGPILADRVAFLSRRLASSRQNPFDKPVRLIDVRIDSGKVITLLSNDLDAPAVEIAALYKQRWQIELFFKWIKQNLKIRHFLGVSENAVKIQIYVALIAFLILHTAHNAQNAIPRPQAFRSAGAPQHHAPPMHPQHQGPAQNPAKRSKTNRTPTYPSLNRTAVDLIRASMFFVQSAGVESEPVDGRDKPGHDV